MWRMVAPSSPAIWPASMMSMIWWCQAATRASCAGLWAYGSKKIDALAPGETIEVHGGTVDAKGESWRALFIAKVPSVLRVRWRRILCWAFRAHRQCVWQGQSLFCGHSVGRDRHERVHGSDDQGAVSKSLDTPEDVSLSVRYGAAGTRYAFLINNSAADKRLCLSELNGARSC